MKLPGGQKGIVVRLLPLDNFSRAYGRQASVEYYKHGRVFDHKISISDLTVVGRVKRLPRKHEVTIQPHAAEIAEHEKHCDIRRIGQGASYDPSASYNVHYEKPLQGSRELRVTRRRK